MRRPQNWKNLPLVLTKQLSLLSSVKKSGEIFSNFCCLLISSELYNSYWKKLLGVRNLQEKLENKNFQLMFFFFTGQIVRQVNQPFHALQRSATRIKRPIIQNWQKQLKFKQLKICVNNIHTTVNRGSKNRL